MILCYFRHTELIDEVLPDVIHRSAESDWLNSDRTDHSDLYDSPDKVFNMYKSIFLFYHLVPGRDCKKLYCLNVVLVHRLLKSELFVFFLLLCTPLVFM